MGPEPECFWIATKPVCDLGEVGGNLSQVCFDVVELGTRC